MARIFDTECGQFPKILTSILALYGGDFRKCTVTEFSHERYTLTFEDGTRSSCWQLHWKEI